MFCYFIDGGSLLLCNPSENLRKLVPESIFNMNQSPPSKLIISKKVSTTGGKPAPLDVSAIFTNENNEAGPSEPENPMEQEQYGNNGVQYKQNAVDQNICLLTRPTMVFILESHNLEKLRYSLKRNLRIATCRIFSLQALNWLMRSVTQASCLHDLLWWFVTSLKLPIPEELTKTDETVSFSFK